MQITSFERTRGHLLLEKEKLTLQNTTFLSALFGIFFGIFQSHSRFGEHESVSWPLWISFSITIYRISLSICLNLKYVLKFLFLPMIFKCALRIQWRCTALPARHGCCHCAMFTKVISKVKRKQCPLVAGPTWAFKIWPCVHAKTGRFLSNWNKCF